MTVITGDIPTKFCPAIYRPQVLIMSNVHYGAKSAIYGCLVYICDCVHVRLESVVHLTCCRCVKINSTCCQVPSANSNSFTYLTSQRTGRATHVHLHTV